MEGYFITYCANLNSNLNMLLLYQFTIPKSFYLKGYLNNKHNFQ